MKKKAKAKTSKKPKIEEMSQTHGKEEENYQPTTLNQIWGDDGMGKYRTLEEEEYIKTVNEMSLSDLRTHSTKIGIVPVDDREVLTKRLLAEFRSHVNKYTGPGQNTNEESELSSEALKILGEGR
jgi:hypothetical protein